MDQTPPNQPDAQPVQPEVAAEPTPATPAAPAEAPAPITLEQHIAPASDPVIEAPATQPVPVTGQDDQPAQEAEMVDNGASTEPAFVWQASEFVSHDKNPVWYLILAGVLVLLLALAFFTKQWLSIGVFVVAAAAIVVYARKPPRTLTYELSHDALSIDGKVYPFNQFRSFSVLQDIAWHTIDLEPTQRFMPRLSILFEDESFDAIVNLLSLHLPRVDRQPDTVERLTRYLRF